jgi:hypothetical protein
MEPCLAHPSPESPEFGLCRTLCRSWNLILPAADLHLEQPPCPDARRLTELEVCPVLGAVDKLDDRARQPPVQALSAVAIFLDTAQCLFGDVVVGDDATHGGLCGQPKGRRRYGDHAQYQPDNRESLERPAIQKVRCVFSFLTLVNLQSSADRPAGGASETVTGRQLPGHCLRKATELADQRGRLARRPTSHLHSTNVTSVVNV